MNFHDDSQILSRLGILESLEESPRRFISSPTVPNKKEAKEKDSFVDVNIEGVDSDADNEETTLDQDTLLTNVSKSKVLRRQSESFLCRYILLLVSYFSLGVMSQSVGSLFPKKMFSSDISCLWQPMGIMIGIITGRAIVFHVDSSIIFLSTYFLSTVLVSAIQILDFSIFVLFQGFLIGAISYTGLTVYFSLWRGHNRKIILFFALFALGSAATLLFNNQSVNIHGELKREAETTKSFLSENNSLVHLTSEKLDTSSGQLSIKMKRDVYGEQAGKSGNKTFSSENFTAVPVRTEVVTTTVKSNLPSNKILSEGPSTFERSTRNKNRYSLSVPIFGEYVPSTSVKIFVLAILLFAICLHTVALICCCNKYHHKGDPRILKLRDITQHGLTVGCRAHLFAFYTLSGIAEGLLILYLSSAAKDYQRTFHCISFIIRFLAIFPGSATYSVLAVLLTAATALFSSVGFALGVGVNVNIIILCATLGFLPLCAFLSIESRLTPLPVTFSDYFLVSYSLGHFVAALFCWKADLSLLPEYISIVVGLLNISLYFLMRVVMKSVRLKDIMEYTTHHGTLEEYLSLVERDHLSGSDVDCQNSNDEL